jgi:hypothetical protein
LQGGGRRFDPGTLHDRPKSGFGYLDTGKVLAKDAQVEDVMFARREPAVEYWEGDQ